MVGHPGSGKTESSRYLAEEHDFKPFTNSAYLQAEAAKRGLILKERSDYEALQRRLRLEVSATFITDMTFQMPYDRILNDGLRNRLDALKFLEKRGILIALNCPLEIRFERTAGSYPRYPTTLEEFKAAELPEYNHTDPFGLHTQWVMDNATYHIDTSGSIADSQLALDKIVATQTALLI